MDDAWERVVEAALDGQGTRSSELRVLNLDGAVKSLHGFLPPAGILERFTSLEHLSIANVGVLSLEKFPRLRNLQTLILSDNRIAGGLENLVQAGLNSLRDLDLSNNRIQYIEDLAPLAKLHLVSLDLYECPVTRVNDYRSKVFSMIRTLKYLDKLDANEDDRPETDDDDEEDEEEYDYDDFDPGSGEVDGDDWAGKLANGGGDFADVDDVIVDADEDEESDADEEEMETSGRGSVNGVSIGSGHHLSNGFRVVSVDGNENDADEDVEVEDDDDDGDDLGEEIDEEEGDDTDVVDVHNVFDSDEEDEDGVDDVEDDEVDIDEEDDDEDDDDEEDLEDDDEVDVDEDEVGVEDEEDTEACSTCRLSRFEEEIDGHEHGEEDENGEIGLPDENGEIGEEDELGVEDRDVDEDFIDGEDEDDLDDDYLVQPIARPNGPASQFDFNVGNEEDDLDSEDGNQHKAFSDSNKRKRDDEGDLDDDDDNMAELRLSKRQ